MEPNEPTGGVSVIKAPFRDRISVGVSRFMSRAVAVVFRVRKGRPPETISRHQYGPNAAEYLDLIPAAPKSPPGTAVVYFHGGGWISGSSDISTYRLLDIAAEGHPVFNVEYPLAPEYPHPQILRSILAALVWIRRHHPEHESVHLMGDSAGGNLAMMAAIMISNPGLAQPLGVEMTGAVPAIQSVVSIQGVLDRLSWIEDGFGPAPLMLRSYAGQAALAAEVAPHLSVTPMDLTFDSLPPSFIVAGSEDRLARSSQICAERLWQQSFEVEYKVYEGAKHGFYTFDSPQSRQLSDDVREFLASR
jgi:acetyl esterase/lipase